MFSSLLVIKFGLSLTQATSDVIEKTREVREHVLAYNRKRYFEECHNQGLLHDLTVDGFMTAEYVDSLPYQWGRKHRASELKKRFIQSIFRLVCEENVKILKAREIIFHAQYKTKIRRERLSAKEQRMLKILASRYRVGDWHDFSGLLKRIDIIPASLALAQGILESGWGKSSAAVTKNSCFGHMANAHDVARFSSLKSCVISYMHNLNVNGAYRKMRDIRYGLRRKKKKITGESLLPGITKYAEKSDYIYEVLSVLNANSLEFFDKILPQ